AGYLHAPCSPIYCGKQCESFSLAGPSSERIPVRIGVSASDKMSRPFGARSARDVHEVPMPLVLVEDVADHAVAAPAHDVVVLAAFLQVDLGAEILAGLVLVVPADHEAGLHIGPWAHPVEETLLAGVANDQVHRFLLLGI